MASEIISKEKLLKAVSAVRECLKKTESKQLFSSDKFFLQVSVKKIVNEPAKLIKILLPHMPINLKTASICLFVKDVNKSARDYESTIEAYKDLFVKCGVDAKIDIFPMKKLKTEFNDYEAKRHLSNLFDVFLCDSRIVRLMPSLLGKHFFGRKKFLRQVRLDRLNIKDELNKCMRTSISDMKNRGATCQVLFGSIWNTDSELAENLEAAMSSLVGWVPGGLDNVRGASIKGEHTPAVPVYVSYGNKSEVDIDDKLPGKSGDVNLDPSKNPNLLLDEAEEVSTVTNGLVVVTENGEVLVIGEDGEVVVDDDGGDDDPGVGGDDDDKDDEYDNKLLERERKNNGGDDDDDGDDNDDDENDDDEEEGDDDDDDEDDGDNDDDDEEEGNDDDEEEGNDDDVGVMDGSKKRKASSSDGRKKGNNNKRMKLEVSKKSSGRITRQNNTTINDNNDNNKNNKKRNNNNNNNNKTTAKTTTNSTNTTTGKAATATRNNRHRNNKSNNNNKNNNNNNNTKKRNIKEISTADDNKNKNYSKNKRNDSKNKRNDKGRKGAKIKRVVVGRSRDDLRYSGAKI